MAKLPGKIYDISGTYTVVFFTVGGVYILATLAFGAIPLIQRRREALSSGGREDEMNGATRFETFRISTKRSTSKSSLQIPPSTGGGVLLGTAGGVPCSTPNVNGFDSTGYSESTAALASAYGAIAAGPGNQSAGGKTSIGGDLPTGAGIGRVGMSAAPGVGATTAPPPPYNSMNYD